MSKKEEKRERKRLEAEAEKAAYTAKLKSQRLVLVLFDEVDLLFADADKGFDAALSKLMKETKVSGVRPV